MATTKIKPIKVRLDHVLNYTKNESKTFNDKYGEIKYQDLHNVLGYIEADYKTENQLYVTGINCTSENAYQQMQNTKQIYNKEKGILAYHLIQAFDNDENITPELAHKIGIELCNELFADRFECVVSTHLNTQNYHNHIVLNSVSFRDGKKYYDNHKTYSAIRHVSDNLCKQYNLNILEEKKTLKTNLNYENFYKKYASENNYKNSTKRDLDFAISQAFSFEDFKLIMKKIDYEVFFRSGKISVRHKKYNRNIRIERAFGEEYSIEKIKQRIIEETSTRIPFIDAYKIKKPKNNHKYKTTHKKAKGILALYYHYCFLLKVFPNTKNIKRRLPVNILEDVKKMDTYSKQAKFLSRENINTKADLLRYKTNIKNKSNDLKSKRESLWRYKKLEKDGQKKIDIETEISNINTQIETIRAELKLIDDIEKRIPEMMEKIQEMENKEKERKVLYKNERSK